jgi:hypothetical protein
MKKCIMTILAMMLTSHVLFAPSKKIKINQQYTFMFKRATEKTALAIKHVESRGNYNIDGLSGEKGAYQFLDKTWNRLVEIYYPEIREKFFYKDTVIIDFSPYWQDLIVKLRIRDLYAKGYSIEQIAAIWNCGKPHGWENKIGVNKLGIKYNVPAYVNKIVEKYNSF